MSRQNKPCEMIVRTSEGSIDYRFYNHRARYIRSSTILNFFKNFFLGKKNSSVNNQRQIELVIQ